MNFGGAGFPPRGFPPPPFNTGMPPPGFQGGPSGPPGSLPPRLQLQMLLGIGGGAQSQPPNGAPFAGISSLMENQASFRPPFQSPNFHGFSQGPSGFGFPGHMSGGAQNSIPGLGDSQDLERLRALENALKEASRGSWQPPGVAPPRAHSSSGHSNDSREDIVARQAEAFIRELQARGQIFDQKNRHDVDNETRRRRRSSSSSSSDSDLGRKKRRGGDSDLEEGEVEEDAPDTRFLHHHNTYSHQPNLPPPLFGMGSQSSYPPPPLLSSHQIDESFRERERDRDHEREKDRRSRRNKNYRDLDAQEEELEAAHAEKSGDKGVSGGKNSFDKLFSAYLSQKAKNDPLHSSSPPPPPSAPALAPDIAPILKSLGPSIQQALSAVGIQVPFSMGPQVSITQSMPAISTPAAPSQLSYALSAFDRDIAKLGMPSQISSVVETMVPTKPLGEGLPPNVKVEIAAESSEWAAAAEEITANLDRPGDQLYANAHLPREIYASRDNKATVAAVQKMIPLIPMIERENVAQRAAEGIDYSLTPILLPVKILEDRVFPPLKESGAAAKAKEQLMQRRRGHQEAAAPGWSKSELHDKMKQARERVNHLKIEQGMVEERLIVMGEELKKLHRYFETNYGVKLVRPADLEDPSELVALAKRREEERLRREQQAALAENDSDSDAPMVYGPEALRPGAAEDSNDLMPDENGLDEGEAGGFEAAMEADSNSNHANSPVRLLKDRREGNGRHHHGDENKPQHKRHGNHHQGHHHRQSHHRGGKRGGGGGRGSRRN